MKYTNEYIINNKNILMQYFKRNESDARYCFKIHFGPYQENSVGTYVIIFIKYTAGMINCVSKEHTQHTPRIS